MDFVMGLPRTRRSHDAIWVVVDRLSKFVHFVAIRATLSIDALADLYIREIVQLHGVPKERLRTAQHRQKYYAYRRRRALEFEVGDSIFLKMSRTKGKLSPRFIGSFEILERIGSVAYRLALPSHLS
ncbi:unnamed protein product [Victoria cruziana]